MSDEAIHPGVLIAAHLRKRNLSLAELARRSYGPERSDRRAHLHRIVTGKYRPTLKTLERIAAGLGMKDVRELLKPPREAALPRGGVKEDGNA